MKFKKKIAIIGSGISGLSAAYFLKDIHDITLYEKSERLGGHSRTIDLPNGKRVDTGFIVLNDRNYPNLIKLFEDLKIEIIKTEMSFSVSETSAGLEWSGGSISSIFAQHKNIFNISMVKGIFDIFKFNRNAMDLVNKFPNLTLQELIDKMSLGSWFRDYYILPMGGAIWSCSYERIMHFPASSFVNFFHNHGLLTINNRPTWYTLKNRSIEYVKKLEILIAQKGRIIKNSSIDYVRRVQDGVEIKSSDNIVELFDEIIFACHPVVILNLLEDATDNEVNYLRKFSRQKNIAYTHSDSNLMPKLKKCWSSWNCLYTKNLEKHKSSISVTYWMNKLQHIEEDFPLFVTLNPIFKIREDKIFDIHEFYHPVFDHQSMIGQKELDIIQGKNRVWYCGAYLKHGFHEDGIWSARNIISKMHDK